MTKKIEHEKNEFDTGAEIRRIRGDLSQQAFAELLGVAGLTIIRYERNERVPDADFLFKLNLLFGVDPTRVVLGRESVHIRDPNEIALLNDYRALPAEDKRTIERMVQLAAQSARTKKKK